MERVKKIAACSLRAVVAHGLRSTPLDMPIDSGMLLYVCILLSLASHHQHALSGALQGTMADSLAAASSSARDVRSSAAAEDSPATSPRIAPSSPLVQANGDSDADSVISNEAFEAIHLDDSGEDSSDVEANGAGPSAAPKVSDAAVGELEPRTYLAVGSATQYKHDPALPPVTIKR